ncbi:MAG: hypothetical protein WC873_00685 [Candidatus Gracilibacteria bacterium]
MKRFSGMTIFGIAVLILAATYGGYLYFQKSAAETDVARMNKIVTDYQNQVLQYQNNNIEQAINAKQTVDAISADTVEWSKIIKEVRRTVPKDAEGGVLVDILSYSGSDNSAISLNMKTIPGSVTPYIDVAKVIQAFSTNPSFKDAFVPSISGGEDEDGKQVLTFMLSAEYVKPSN